MAPLVIAPSAQTARTGALTKAERDRLTPAQVIEALKLGNERFRTGRMAVPRRSSSAASTRARPPSWSSTRVEFGCAVAGAKVLLLFGHTACGAIKGAIDDVEMGNLTGLLARVKPAITATTFTGDTSSKNAAYVDAVARTNVIVGLDNLRRRSPIRADLETKKPSAAG